MENSEAFKPKITVPTVNQGGGNFVFFFCFSAKVSRNLVKNNGNKEQDQ